MEYHSVVELHALAMIKRSPRKLGKLSLPDDVAFNATVSTRSRDLCFSESSCDALIRRR